MKKAKILANLKDLRSSLRQGLTLATANQDRALAKVIRKMRKAQEKLSIDLNTKLYDLEQLYAPEHPEHTRGDWIEEVAASNTIIGYWEWLLHKLEEA